MQVALPELDGAMEPIVFAGRDPTTGKSHSLPDRLESLCTRAIKWASLRKKKVAEKKVAITVFSFPPDKGNVGTAAYLNVFGSIFKVLKDMKQQGYDVCRLSLWHALSLESPAPVFPPIVQLFAASFGTCTGFFDAHGV